MIDNISNYSIVLANKRFRNHKRTVREIRTTKLNFDTQFGIWFHFESISSLDHLALNIEVPTLQHARLESIIQDVIQDLNPLCITK